MPRSHHSFNLRKSRHYSFMFVFFILAVVIAIFFISRSNAVPIETILSGLGLSFYRLVVAYLISLVVAIAVAVIVASNRNLGDSLIPLFDIMQNLPSFALIPLFAYALGYTDQMAIIFAATSIVWPILFYLIHALTTARRDWEDAATVFGAKGIKHIWHFLLPLGFPALVTGSIVGFSIGWEAIIGIEIIGLHRGIGVFLNSSVENRPALAAGLAILLLLVLVLNRLVWMPLLKRTQLYAE
ncbi:MAG: ABC transporter permease subunit [Candidatus Vogelbacteria bacterium]|nr:ABC transporter permease subunit [Candidatus Vogelbacteria bacterium]